MSELKPCPFHNCLTCGCYDTLYMRDKDWNTRPIEDALNARIAELEAECASLGVRLHDEMSQLEIATDLGNKRWTALNEIYEKSEKHSAWWCKRKAQEGLGIK